MKRYRVLTFLMLITMLFSIVPPGYVYATEDSADSKIVQFLLAFDIMKQDEQTGLFWDNTPVRRSEMAEILCNLLDLEVVEDAERRFDDVPGDKRAYIETAVRHGQLTGMAGYDDGKFGPDDYITNEQLVKIMVCVIGADTYAERIGGYPDGYMKIGEAIGIIKNASVSSGKNVASRIDVAKIIYNVLHTGVPEMKTFNPNGFNFSDLTGSKTFLNEKMDIYIADGIMTQSDMTSLARPEELSENLVKVGDVFCYDNNHILDTYLGCNIRIYYRQTEDDLYGEVVYVEEKSKNETHTIKYSNIADISGNVLKYYDEEKNDKLRNAEISVISDMIYNGKAIHRDLERIRISNGTIKIIDNNDDGVYDVVIITEYQDYVVENVYPEDEKIILKFNEPAIDLEDKRYLVLRDGNVSKFTDIVAGDVLSVAMSEDEELYRIEATSVAVRGVASTYRDEKLYLEIGSETYPTSYYFENLLESGKISNMLLGVSGKFMLNGLGEVTYWEPTEVINEVGYLVKGRLFEDEFDENVSIKIYTSKGKMEKFTLAERIKVNGSGIKRNKFILNALYMEQITTPQLVEFTSKEGQITSISFSGTTVSPSSTKFSLDVKGDLRCTATGVLENKYYCSGSTIVFRIPSNAANIEEEKYYEVRTGPFFEVDSNAMLYDVDEMGNVKYAVNKYNTSGSQIGYQTGLAIVTKTHVGLDEYGDIVTIYDCINESGQEISIKTDDEGSIVKIRKSRTRDEDGNVTSVKMVQDSTIEIESGDIIQYKINADGFIHAIVLQHKNDEEDFYTSESIEVNNQANAVHRASYGRVVRINSNQLLLACRERMSGTSHLSEVDQLVMNNGGIIYKVFEGGRTKVIEKISFDDIKPSDRVYACIKRDNKTRMIVVYE